MEKVLKILTKKQNEIVRFTQSLIRINSCGNNETEVGKAIQRKLKEYSIKGKFSGENKKRMNFQVDIKGQKSDKRLLLCGHMDTVPPGNLSRWKYPPFLGKLSNLWPGSFRHERWLSLDYFCCLCLKAGKG